MARRGTAVLLSKALVVSLVGLGGVAAADGGCAGPATGGEWPVSGKEVFASRFQDQENVIGVANVGQLQPAWVLPADGSFESTPVVAGGCVYIATQSGHVYALNADDGQLAWDATLPGATTLSIGGGRVFVQSNSVMTALDATTGAVVWQKDISPDPRLGGSGSPLAFESYVVAGLTGCGDSGGAAGCRGYYAILDQATGATVVDGFDTSDEDLARGMRGPGFWSQPTYDPEDKYIYFGTSNTRSLAPENPVSNALLQIDADPGRSTFGKIVNFFREEFNPIANYPGVQQFCAQAAPGSYTVCTDDDDWPSSAVIYRDSQGRKLVGSTHSSSGLPVRTYFSFAVPNGNYFALDPDTMQEVWRSPTSGARAAIAAYDGTRIYHSSGYNGELIAVDKDTGAVIWQAPTFAPNIWQHVSAANGVVYTPSTAGLLLAFDARDGTPLLQRPMMQDIGGPAAGTIAGGIAIARNTVFAPVNGASGYLVAYRLP